VNCLLAKHHVPQAYPNALISYHNTPIIIVSFNTTPPTLAPETVEIDSSYQNASKTPLSQPTN